MKDGILKYCNIFTQKSIAKTARIVENHLAKTALSCIMVLGGGSVFRRKVTGQLMIWKEKYVHSYAAMLEGARRVGKSTIAENFAKRHFRSYIKVDFANVSGEILEIFQDIANLDLFFLRLQAATHVTLYRNESVIIFDEIQRAPLVRQAIKYLVADGRYAYIETGSLLSIKKNVRNIVIPSEEYKIPVYPMDYEEFLWASQSEQYSLLRALYQTGEAVGNQFNDQLMRDLRIYMAVGGMPQAVEAYVSGRNFEEIDFVKRQILNLYHDDFYKIDSSGRISMIYDAIPSQLALNRKRFILSSALNKRTTSKDFELFSDLLSSRTVLPCFHVSQPTISLSQTKELDTYKMYLADTGLFVTMLFGNESGIHREIYSKLLSNKIDANLGYLYENLCAQMIRAGGYDLYYHTWQKENSTHCYEVDFLLPSKLKLVPLEVKSSSIKPHPSISTFMEKYSSLTGTAYLLSQKDVSHEGMLKMRPFYMLPFILEDSKS